MARTCSVARDDISKCAKVQFDAKDVIIITSTASVIQQIAVTVIAARAHNPITALLGGADDLPPDIRRREPARHPDYRRLYNRIVCLEDTIGHFYNVINVLRERVSMLEEEVKARRWQTNLNQRRGS
jgi:hypothetical protein